MIATRFDKLVVRREHHGLPQRALVALGVAGDHVSRARRALQARRERGARRDRESLAQRAGREVDAGQGVLRVRAESGDAGAERRQLLVAQPAGCVQRRVERKRGVAFRQNEAIAVGIGQAAPVRSGPAKSAATMSAIERLEPMWPTLARRDCSMITRRIR